MSNSPFPQNVAMPDATGADARVSAFLRSVYGWMFFGLAVTAAVATTLAGSPSIVNAWVANRLLFFGLIAARIGLVVFLSARVTTRSA